MAMMRSVSRAETRFHFIPLPRRPWFTIVLVRRRGQMSVSMSPPASLRTLMSRGSGRDCRRGRSVARTFKVKRRASGTIPQCGLFMTREFFRQLLTGRRNLPRIVFPALPVMKFTRCRVSRLIVIITRRIRRTFRRRRTVTRWVIRCQFRSWPIPSFR